MAAAAEQVKRLQEQSGADEESCREALEHCRGDCLDAYLALEQQGKCTRGKRGGEYSTAPGGSAGAAARMALALPGEGQKDGRKDREEAWKESLRELWKVGKDLLRRALTDQLEVWRGGRVMASVPVLILILLAVTAFWLTVPLLLLGLVMGCQYRFTGPMVTGEEGERMMEEVSAAVDDVVEHLKREFRDK